VPTTIQIRYFIAPATSTSEGIPNSVSRRNREVDLQKLFRETAGAAAELKDLGGLVEISMGNKVARRFIFIEALGVLLFSESVVNFLASYGFRAIASSPTCH
jgi:hypothetical protein